MTGLDPVIFLADEKMAVSSTAMMKNWRIGELENWRIDLDIHSTLGKIFQQLRNPCRLYLLQRATLQLA